MAEEEVVVVTGFGPFSVFTENPSSMVVDELAKQKIPGFDGKLVTAKLSCVYGEVEEMVKQLWTQYSPKLVVHLGVHPHIHQQINLEQRSFGRGYCRYDNDGRVPVGNVCSTCKEPVLKTSINCSEIASQVMRELESTKLKITASYDPGRFLCAYSFYLSLTFDADRAVFIHIPSFDANCTLQMVTAAVQKIIATILKTLDRS